MSHPNFLPNKTTFRLHASLTCVLCQQDLVSVLLASTDALKIKLAHKNEISTFFGKKMKICHFLGRLGPKKMSKLYPFLNERSLLIDLHRVIQKS